MLARYFPLTIFLLLVVTASVIGAGFEAGEWYHVTMRQPSFLPPYWLFGVAWALVHVFMAVAAWEVWLTGHGSRNRALAWWGLLLVMNVGWSALIFGLHRPGWSWLLLSLTIVFSMLCVRFFSLLSRTAAYLMGPYLVWIVFAWTLNLAIWTLNGGYFQKFVS
jgi:tryptophan-rich sensory protein